MAFAALDTMLKLWVLTLACLGVGTRARRCRYTGAEIASMITTLGRDCTVIDVPRNSITALRVGDFDAYPNAEKIMLAGNKIADIEPHTFSGLRKLWQVNLNGNKISHVPQGVFDSLPFAQGSSFIDEESGEDRTPFVQLDDNEISAVDDSAFANVHKLSLSRNPLGTLRRLWFDGQRRVMSYLRAEGAQLEHVDDDLQEALAPGAKIDIMDNPIHEQRQIDAEEGFRAAREAEELERQELEERNQLAREARDEVYRLQQEEDLAQHEANLEAKALERAQQQAEAEQLRHEQAENRARQLEENKRQEAGAEPERRAKREARAEADAAAASSEKASKRSEHEQLEREQAAQREESERALADAEAAAAQAEAEAEAAQAALEAEMRAQEEEEAAAAAATAQAEQFEAEPERAEL